MILKNFFKRRSSNLRIKQKKRKRKKQKKSLK